MSLNPKMSRSFAYPSVHLRLFFNRSLSGDPVGQLNELKIKAAQPRDKEYLLSDGEGLYLRVRPNRKVWIYRYKAAGKQAKLSFGSYPTVSLAMARRKPGMRPRSAPAALTLGMRAASSWNAIGRLGVTPSS